MVHSPEHDVRVYGHPVVRVFCMVCKDADGDPVTLHRFDRGHAPSMLEINTVSLNHYRDKVPPADVELDAHPMPDVRRVTMADGTSGVFAYPDDAEDYSDEGLELG